MKKAVIYARVSTEEQATHGKSIDTQEKLCRKWANENNYQILSVYKDEGKSATNLNRPALQEMLADISGTNCDIILVQDTDRLARNTLDHLTIKAILKKKKIQLVSISQLMIDDSPEGDFMDTIIAGVNTFQSQITGRKVRKVLEQKAISGWYPGSPPLGYKTIENPHPNSQIEERITIIDSSTAPYVIKAFEMYSEGSTSLKAVAKYLNKHSIKSRKQNIIYVSSLNRIFRNPFYIGRFVWSGKEYEGKHDPLITEALFQKVQQVLDAHNHSTSRERKHNFLLRGVLYCADCGNRYWAERHIKANGNVYSFYFCSSCKGSSYSDTSAIESKVEGIFSKIQLSKEYTQHVLDVAKKIFNETKANQNSEQKRLQAQRSKIQKAIRGAEDDRFIHKTLSPEAFQKIYHRYSSDLENTEVEIKSLHADHSQSIKILEDILKLAENIGNAYLDAQYPLKRKYLALFIKKILIRDGKIIKTELSDDVKGLIKNSSVRVTSNVGD